MSNITREELMSMVARRVFTLSDGRRLKEVQGVNGCDGCMFFDRPRNCNAPINADLRGCLLRNTIYQPADPEAPAEPVGYLWRHAGTGRTRLVGSDCVITTRSGGWELVGPLFLGAPEAGKREPLTDDQIVDALVDYAGFNLAYRSYEDDMKFACAIERAHGIDQQDKGTDHA